MTYMNFSPEAGWRGTIQTHEQYIANETELSPFHILPGWRKEMVLRDWAHLQPIGFGRDLGGGLIKSMFKRGELGAGPLDAQLRGLFAEMNVPPLDNIISFYKVFGIYALKGS